MTRCALVIGLLALLAAGRVVEAARAFTATTDNVSASSDTNGDLHTALTVCAWVYPTATPSSTGFVVIHGASTTAPNFEYYIAVNTNATVSMVPQVGSSANTLTSNVVAVNTWSDVCGTWDGTTARIFLGGTQGGTAAAAGTFTHLSNLTEYGASSLAFWSGFHFVGRVADAGIWNVADVNIPVRFHQRTAPMLIRRDALKSYRPLAGSSPEPDLFSPFTAAVTGATVAAGPSVMR